MCPMRFLVLIVIFLGCLALTTSAAERPLWIGMDRAELTAAMGQPHSKVIRGTREILIFPGGARFELEEGKVVSIEGFKGRIDLVPPDPKTLESSADKTASVGSSQAAPQQGAGDSIGEGTRRADLGRSSGLRPVARQVALPTYGDAVASDAGKLVEIAAFLYHLHDPRWHAENGVTHAWPSLLGAIAGRLLLCLIGLRLAGRVYDRELGWGEVTAIAAIESGVRLLLLELLFLTLFHVMPFYAVELVMAFIQLILVHYWLKEPDWWMAIRIVATAKAAIIAITFALFTVMLNVIAK